MRVDHTAILRDNFTFLQDNITVSRGILLDTLYEVDVLDEQEVAEIRSKKTELEKVNELLHITFRTSYKQCQFFVAAMNRADHTVVYDRLKGIQMNLRYTKL